MYYTVSYNNYKASIHSNLSLSNLSATPNYVLIFYFLFLENMFNTCFDTLEYKYGKHYYDYQNDVDRIFLTVLWKPVEKQTCLSITYYHNLDSDMDITMSISDVYNNTLITSTLLEKYVSNILFSIPNAEKVSCLSVINTVYTLFLITSPFKYRRLRSKFS